MMMMMVMMMTMMIMKEGDETGTKVLKKSWNYKQHVNLKNITFSNEKVITCSGNMIMMNKYLVPKTICSESVFFNFFLFIFYFFF